MIARYSSLFVPTLKEAPAEAQAVSHKLLVRAGFIRQLGAGIYSLLPLARRTLAKIEGIVREEMNAIGGQEFSLPALHPEEVWRQSGRWDVMGENMFRLRDRKGAWFCLGMTHEEIFTALARDELKSYRQLPQTWYQIQTKFRDEPRPKAGLLRVREFSMKDSYSFDIDASGLERSYELHRQAYERIFARCGLTVTAVTAHSGAMGGSGSQEFMVRTEVGEDDIALCQSCGAAANLETARSKVERVKDEKGSANLERFATPGVVTIEALTKPPYDVPAQRQLKTLVYIADDKPVIAVVRGDHMLNEAKLQIATAAQVLRPAHADEIEPLMGAHAGSLGAVKLTKAAVFVDEVLAERTDMVTGANEDGYHLRGVDVGRDLLGHGRLADLRVVAAGESCTQCSAALVITKALEVGHIFKLGTRYSMAMGATVLNQQGASTPLVMGSYGIGIGRIMAAAVELHHDERGICWPSSIAPYDATVVALGSDTAIVKAATQAAETLASLGMDVLLDDRDERAGVKLSDADLVGVPLRITVGKRGVESGYVEVKRRREAGEAAKIPLTQLASAQVLLEER